MKTESGMRQHKKQTEQTTYNAVNGGKRATGGRRSGHLYIWWMLGGVTLAMTLLFAFSYIKEYRPADVERLFTASHVRALPDTLTLVSWNIGYAGLGENMDFFYDGGTRVRDTRERTRKNLDRIITQLRELNPDVILLQEVDSASRRSYGINEVAALRAAFPDYWVGVGLNYVAWWVPIPVCEPMGGVTSGVVTLARVAPVEAVRYQYPSAFPFPARMFNLKRCLLTTDFVLASGDTLRINNTHNTAYDTGGMRTQEMDFLANALRAAPHFRSITGGDWNQFPPRYTPTPAELSDPNFVPERVDSLPFAGLGQFAYDTTAHTLRYLDRPYVRGNTETVTDFFFLSPTLGLQQIKVLDLGYASSDHNPIFLRVVCEKNHSNVF